MPGRRREGVRWFKKNEGCGEIVINQTERGKSYEKKKYLEKISGAAAVGVMAVSIILPVQAATEAARATYYLEHFNEYRVYEGTKSAAVTEGGSAYDDRGFAVNAHLVAGVINADESNYGYRNFIGSTNESAKSAFLDGVIQYVHDCEIGHVQ